MDHNSYKFHQDFGRISPEDEYANQLQTAIMAVQKFGGTPESAASAYGVRVQDIVNGMRAQPNVPPGQQRA